MQIAFVQDRFSQGCIESNFDKICKYNEILDNTHGDIDVIVYPELALQGYPAMDLYTNPAFIIDGVNAKHNIIEMSKKYPYTLIIFGATSLLSEVAGENKIFNGIYCVNNGKLLAYNYKTLIPEYDVFDEARYFHSSDKVKEQDSLKKDCLFFKGKKIGLLICEDIWDYNYTRKPYNDLIEKQKPDYVISINASPFCIDKPEKRKILVANLLARYDHKPEYFAYLNMVGGQDGYDGELIFDGNSFVMNSNGQVVLQMESFDKDLKVFDTDKKHEITYQSLWSGFKDPYPDIHDALVLGIRDYIQRCGAKGVVIGLSGGIDSAVVAALAAEALGNDHVTGITMPSNYSSEGSVDDSLQLAMNLGIKFLYSPIKSILSEYKNILNIAHTNCNDRYMYADFLKDITGTLTEENLQARIRGNILMAYSNSKNYLVLSTGNKTELALGYCTIYGDLCGGLSVIADLSKPYVYGLAKYINQREGRVIIPLNTIEKPPSAELAPGQTDEKGLGAGYDILGPLVDKLIEGESRISLFKQYDSMLVDKVIKLIRINEFKRRQAPPGIKLTPKAFGHGRRIPWYHEFKG
jgi:NAD+ synthase (glutamine-hydrolysing)